MRFLLQYHVAAGFCETPALPMWCGAHRVPHGRPAPAHVFEPPPRPPHLPEGSHAESLPAGLCVRVCQWLALGVLEADETTPGESSESRVGAAFMCGELGPFLWPGQPWPPPPSGTLSPNTTTHAGHAGLAPVTREPGNAIRNCLHASFFYTEVIQVDVQDVYPQQ